MSGLESRWSCWPSRSAASNCPKIEHAQHKVGEKVNDSIWKHPESDLWAIAIFVYVGAEVSIGSFLVNYFGQPEIGGLTEKVAASFVAFYWGGAMVGRSWISPASESKDWKPARDLCRLCRSACRLSRC